MTAPIFKSKLVTRCFLDNVQFMTDNEDLFICFFKSLVKTDFYQLPR